MTNFQLNLPPKRLKVSVYVGRFFCVSGKFYHVLYICVVCCQDATSLGSAFSVEMAHLKTDFYGSVYVPYVTRYEKRGHSG